MSHETAAARLNRANLPRHLAIIMDGNGRWARQRGLPRIEGHRAGARAVDEAVSFCRYLGIGALTLYSFSKENWKRPEDEVGALMGILKSYIARELGRMLREDIRFNVIGVLADLPAFAREAVEEAMERTRHARGMTLTLALSYGSRDEIVRAARSLAADAASGRMAPEAVTEESFAARLDTAGLADPDLLIRTSGELRVSNFLLWQLAYTEFYFTPKLWPDIGADDIAEAISAFQNRERRFGGTAASASLEP